MGALNHIVQELEALGAPLWIIVAVVIIGLLFYYGPKWLEIILKHSRENKRIMNEDRRKNEKHNLEIEEKLLKQEERRHKLEVAKQGKKS